MNPRHPSGERQDVLAQVARRIPAAVGDRCVRVAIDGVDGSGKSTFAAELGVLLRSAGRDVVDVSADGFHHVRAIRHRRGRASPVGFWLDSYDYRSLFANVLDPLGPSGDRRYRTAVHDVVTDERLDLPWRQTAPGAVLVLDGLFLHRDELAGQWDLSVFLDVPFGITAARMAQRDGTHPDPEHASMARYVEGQRLYFSACAPWRRADLVIDNSDPDRPNIVVARSALDRVASAAAVTSTGPAPEWPGAPSSVRTM